MSVYLHEEDLPAGVLADGPVAVDTETMGLVTPTGAATSIWCDLPPEATMPRQICARFSPIRCG
jgi:hypothetical protein